MYTLGSDDSMSSSTGSTGCLTAEQLTTVIGYTCDSPLYDSIMDHLLHEEERKFKHEEVGVCQVVRIEAASVYNQSLDTHVVYAISLQDTLGDTLHLADDVGDITRCFLASIDLHQGDALYHPAFLSTIAKLTPDGFINTKGSSLSVATLLRAWAKHVDKSRVYPVGTFGAEFSEAMVGINRAHNMVEELILPEPDSDIPVYLSLIRAQTKGSNTDKDIFTQDITTIPAPPHFQGFSPTWTPMPINVGTGSTSTGTSSPFQSVAESDTIPKQDEEIFDTPGGRLEFELFEDGIFDFEISDEDDVRSLA